MRSVLMLTPGMSSLARETRSRKASLVCPLRMRASTEVDPLWAGRCRDLHRLGRAAMRESTDAGKSCKCIHTIKRTWLGEVK